MNLLAAVHFLFFVALYLATIRAERAPLFGFSNTSGLVSIDVVSGLATPIGSPAPDELEAQQLSSIDPPRNLLYMSGFNASNSQLNVLGFDLATGDVTVTIKLPFLPNTFVGLGVYIAVDTHTGDIYATGPEWRVGQDGERHIVLRIDYDTKKQTNVGVIPKGVDVIGGDSTFDPINRVLWCTYGSSSKTQSKGNHLYAVHVDNGAVEEINDSPQLSTLNYDSSTGRIYGLSIRRGKITQGEPDYVRMLVFIDSNDETRAVQVVGEETEYIGGDAAIAAIDEGARLHMSYMQPPNQTLEDPWYFVSIDADKGDIVDARKVGNYFTLPWSLEAYNANLRQDVVAGLSSSTD
jgi:hypothetical protein